jgi:hypothetical protein
VHLLFLDESGRLSERKLFALGGIALRDTDWHALNELWQHTLAVHGWPADREVKWHGIRKGEVPPALGDAIVESLAHAPVTCYVTLLDVELGLELTPEFVGSDEETSMGNSPASSNLLSSASRASCIEDVVSSDTARSYEAGMSTTDTTV